MKILKPRPIVSIIMASYNHAPFAKQAVLTSLNQNIGRVELIVVDDGSTDGTPDIIEKLNDRRITLVRLAQNRSEHPRNLALNIAKGHHIAFQNSDDEWEVNKLGMQLQALESDLTCVACFTGVNIINKNGTTVKNSWANDLFTTKNRKRAEWLRHFFDTGNCLCISSALVRSSSIKSVGYFKPSLIQLSDFDLWVRLAALGNFHIIDKPLTKMRIVNNQNISRPTIASQRRSGIEFIDILMRYADPPLIDQLDAIFHDALVPQATSSALRLADLAMRAWGQSASHRLFADRVMARLIDNPEHREEITKLYGTSIIHEFIKRRGQLEVIVDEKSTQ